MNALPRKNGDSALPGIVQGATAGSGLPHKGLFLLSDPVEISESWEQLARLAEFRSQKLAAMLNVSIRTVQRHFQQHYQMTLIVWLRSVRLKDGFSRIASGEQIKAVAFDLGYKQLSHFSRSFRRFFGIAPRDVRQTLRNYNRMKIPQEQ